jgi:WD40 repeat protein
MKFFLTLLLFSFFAGCGPASGRKDAKGGGRKALPPDPRVTPRKIALSSDGKLLLLVCSASDLPRFQDYLTLWDTTTGKILCTLPAPNNEVTFIAFLPDSKRALAANADGTLSVYELARRKLVRRIKVSEKSCSLVVISPDGKLALAAGRDTNFKIHLKVWDVATGKSVKTIDKVPPPLGYLAWSPDGRWVLTGSRLIEQDNTVRLWDVTSGKIAHTFPGKRRWEGPFAFAPNNKWAVLNKIPDGGNRKAFPDLVLWNLQGKKIMQTLKRNDIPSLEGEGYPLVAVSPDGNQLIGKDYDEFLQFWDVRTGRLIQSLSVDPAPDQFPKGRDRPAFIHGYCLSRDGTRAAAVTGENKEGGAPKYFTLRLHIWDLQKSKLLRSWQWPGWEPLD